MHRARNPRARALAFTGTAIVAAVALLVWFTVIVQQAQTRGQHRRAYQQLTGEIMMPLQADGRQSAAGQHDAKQKLAALALAQR